MRQTACGASYGAGGACRGGSCTGKKTAGDRNDGRSGADFKGSRMPERDHGKSDRKIAFYMNYHIEGRVQTEAIVFQAMRACSGKPRERENFWSACGSRKKKKTEKSKNKMTGILFGTGIGPGDPELMTLKAVRLIREMIRLQYQERNRKRALPTRLLFRQCRNWQKKSSLLFQCR